ncbi:MAG TPA: glycine zipper 2TM domain-containing protein [Noviherbaspirillum sp.]|jgi:outer membrane lipoprotein SlyB|uniref:glycine zipper 2TM domain-containing protein n=1 Tax=Noviherbaspirillum sp. TaxID=1926288 RepID=UPI002F93F2EE
MNRTISGVIGCAVIVLAAACASDPVTSSTQGSTVVRNGQVTGMRDVTIRGGRGTGIGSFVGAILGGVAGSAIGSGHGSTVASIGGAVGGSMAGQHVEESSKSSQRTELTVRLDSGEVQTYQVDPGDRFRIGDPVRVTTTNGITRVTR